MNIDKLTESLRKHEGLSLLPYEDTEGFLTIGFGTNLDAGISLKQAYALLEIKIAECEKELDRAFPRWRDHNEARQNVLMEMQYNLGAPRLKKFVKMWAALDGGDYSLAALELLRSRWHEQVGQRARTLADQMQSGEFA